MNAKQHAASELRAFGLKLKGIIALSDDLERIGSLEQYEGEVKNRIKLAETQEGNAALRLKDVSKQLAEAEAQITGARAAAAEMAKAAKDAGDRIRATALEEARAIEAESKKRVADLEGQYKIRCGDLAGVNRDITASTGRLQQLQEQIQKVKEDARKQLS